MSETTPPTDTQGAVPKAPIREDSISQFKKESGDPSRSFLYLVVAAVVALILGILFFTDAPEGSAPTVQTK